MYGGFLVCFPGIGLVIIFKILNNKFKKMLNFGQQICSREGKS